MTNIKKQLLHDKREMQALYEEKIFERDEINKELSLLAQQIHDLKKQIKGVSQKTISVSDHAILRYLERAEGLDIEDLRIQIENKLGMLPNCVVPFEGLSAVIKDGTLVTFTPPGRKKTKQSSGERR